MSIEKPQLPHRRYQEQEIAVEGEAGIIEAKISAPAIENSAHAVAIICHPHPLHEGTMDNKIVVTIARTLTNIGIPCIRFNFRGVGKSVGEYGEGVGEVRDLETIIDYVKRNFPGHELWLAGFSFGGYIAIKTAQTHSIEQLITVAPAVRMFEMVEVEHPNCPWLIIQGEADDIVPCRDIAAWAEKITPQPDIKIFPEVGHFFHGHLNDLKISIEQHLANNRHELQHILRGND